GARGWLRVGARVRPPLRGLEGEAWPARDQPRIIPGWGGTQRLVRACGVGVAKDLILTGRLVDADEALRIGLLNAVHDPVLEKAQEVAQLLASKSPLALAAAKRALNHSLQGDNVENLQLEADEFGSLFVSEDAKEGLTAFAEKREPRFTGR